MRKDNIFPASFNPDRFLLSILFSVGLAYLIREPIFPLILMGRSFSARSQLFQIAFSLLLVCLFAGVLYFTFGRLIDRFTNNYAISVALLSLIPLAAYAIMGSYSRFVADDFSSATLAVNKGILGATWDWYINWSGRFSASFFDSLVGYFGPELLRHSTWVAIALWLWGLISLAKTFFQSKRKFQRIAFSTLASALILTTTFETTPLLSQSLYWGQGMRSVILPLVAGTFLISLISMLIKKKQYHWSSLILVAGLSFFAGGFGETYVAVQTTGLLITLFMYLTLFSFNWKNVGLPIITAGLAGSLLAIVLIVAAPGNSVRQSYFPLPPDIFNLLRISFLSLGEYLKDIIISPYRIEIYFVLLLVSIILGVSGFHAPKTTNPKAKFLTRSIWINHSSLISLFGILLISSIMLFACFVPSAYGMSTAPPDRTLVIPTFILSVSLAFLGFVFGNQISPAIKKSFTNQYKFSWLKISAWTAILLFCGFIGQVTNNILSLRSDYQHFAVVFDSADETIRNANAEGQDFVEVPEVHNHFGLSDYGAGTTFWLDEAVNSYYGINVVVNKHIKVK